MLWRVMTETGSRVNSLGWRGPAALVETVRAAAAGWDETGGTRRLWAKDAALWTGADEAKWLGWLDIVDAGAPVSPELKAFLESIERFFDGTLGESEPEPKVA